jgi:hypothetical protein
MSNTSTSLQLVGLEEGRIAIFGNGPEAPSKRLFAEWKSKGFYPYLKCGKRVFLNVEDVKAALNRRFKINAVEVR